MAQKPLSKRQERYERLERPIGAKRRIALSPEQRRERAYAAQKRWALKNPEKMKALYQRHYKKHAAKYAVKAVKRRAALLMAIPAWANEFFIEEIYDLAVRRTNSTGFKWHVDHIVPLQSDLVCGLHVEHNLQVIPASENLRKRNCYWPDMPESTDTKAELSVATVGRRDARSRSDTRASG